GNDESINLTSKLTISLKFRVDGYPKTISPLVYKGWISGSQNVFNGTERTYSLWVENTGLIHLTSADSRGQQFINTPSKSIKLNTWYHYIGIIDREEGVMKSYLDGNLIAKGKIRKSTAVYTSKPLLIGSSHEKYHKFSNFNGAIEEVKIYNRSLNQEEIEILFNE
ncbi:MAG: LamG domain-containing protein, partial [Candidatus Delongbacteria bacterium]|nr:LamG domain-containing protein [Candidatus Delongbacteria bacterium]